MKSKACTKCGETKSLLDFYLKKESKDGRHSHCKVCRNSYRKTRPRASTYKERNLEYYYRNKDKWKVIKAKRRAAKLNATPMWADKQAIDFVYYCCSLLNKKGCDYEVDHIVPLQGNTVCGLHVHNNLQLLRKVDNRKKSNSFE